jgi:hypothetical protein
VARDQAINQPARKIMSRNPLNLFESPQHHCEGSRRHRITGACRFRSHSCLPGVIIILSALFAPAVTAQDDPRIAASSGFASSLQQQLGARLKAAMQSGGPVNAIEVCQVEAPRIAAKLSAGGGPSRVWRTALKVRNPLNSPDAEALRVLQEFAQALAEGEPAPMSEFIVHTDGSARYMQSIVTQEICLACHGTALPENVQAALAERYPDDQATGFSAGDLRGAFVVDWPAPGK